MYPIQIIFLKANNNSLFLFYSYLKFSDTLIKQITTAPFFKKTPHQTVVHPQVRTKNPLLRSYHFSN